MPETITATPILTLTEAAAGRVRALFEKHDAAEGTALRIFMKEEGGRLGHGMAIEDEIAADDLTFDQHGIKVVVDPDSAPLLYGATFDYYEDDMQSGFAVQNPNLQGGCGGGGCGSGCSCSH
jgi:iron-sulfur cluster assembly accessory protein